MRKLSKVIALLLATSCAIITASSCSEKRDMSINVSSSLVDYSKKADENVMDIYAFRGPTDLTDTQWQYLKDSGINTLIIDSTEGGKMQSSFGASGQEQYIRKCKEYGLKAIGFTLGNAITNVKDYSNTDLYDTIAGIDYDDEPSVAEFENIAAVIPDFSSKYAGKKFYNCVLSSGAGAHHMGTPNYQDYLDEWYDVVLSQLPEGMPRVLASDVYPLMGHSDEKGGCYTDDKWLRSLAYLGGMKLKHPELILHMAMQSTSFGGYPFQTGLRRLPSEADCKFQAYVTTSFGFTEISWFTYSTPPADGLEFNENHVAMIDRDGNRTQCYYAVQATNAELALLDELLLSLTWRGVYPIHADKTADKNAFSYLSKMSNVVLDVSDFSCVKQISADKNAIVGQFTDENGNEVFSLVNYSDPTKNVSATINLDFVKCNKIIVYRNGVPAVFDVKENSWSIKLSPGEGVYVIPYEG